MKKKDASFWSDIKALDERLTREPDSFCFARLSEIYLKVGLVADALHTARTGVAKHPGYLAGLRALGMACNASGLDDECRTTLERVTAAMPEDVDAQKVLARLYVAAGNQAAAMRTYSTVLDFRPDDKASAAELEALQQGGTTCPNESSSSTQTVCGADGFDKESSELEIIDLSESDIVEEPAEEELNVVAPTIASVTPGEHHDPLSTLTLAELYEQQGFLSKALDIYRTILADDPANPQLLAKVAELEGGEPVAESAPEESLAEGFDDEIDFSEPVAKETLPAPLEFPSVETTQELPAEEFESEAFVAEPHEDVAAPVEFQTFEPALESPVEAFESDMSVSEVPTEEAAQEFQTFELPAEPAVDSIASDFSVSEDSEDIPATLESQAFEPLAHKAADNVVDTLDGWLENIRRIKACR